MPVGDQDNWSSALRRLSANWWIKRELRASKAWTPAGCLGPGADPEADAGINGTHKVAIFGVQFRSNCAV